MATYYRWRKSTVIYTEQSTTIAPPVNITINGGTGIYAFSTPPTFNPSSGEYEKGIFIADINEGSYSSGFSNEYFGFNNPATTLYRPDNSGVHIYGHGNGNATLSSTGSIKKWSGIPGPGTSEGYVYSTSASAYPNGGVSGSYYYDQRTTITSPVAPTSLTYPNPILTPSVNVSWPASVSNVPAYSISTYEVSYATNGGSNWTVAGATAATSLSVDLPAGVASVQFRVRAQDSNGQWSDYTMGTVSNVILAPTLTVPSMAMQEQNITINWSSVDAATSYTLQRKANTDDDWVQVYSGDALTFTETAGEWTSVQYQVQAVFSSGTGGWATSASIPVVSASALVISGTDEDLGTLTADVPYTVSSDTGNTITLTRTVNGVLVASLTVQNGFAYNIPVMDLPTGTGTIVISATVQATSGSVSATRTWTYTKAAMAFPNTGSTAQLQQDGKNVFPATLAECVRVGANLGGNLGLALQALANSVQYNPETGEVTIPGGGVAPIPRIETGSYVGTGTYGEGSPNTLTFSFNPKLIIIMKNGNDIAPYKPKFCGNDQTFFEWVVFIAGISFVFTDVFASSAYKTNIAWDGNKVSYYNPWSTASQLNESSVTYRYVAFG